MPENSKMKSVRRLSTTEPYQVAPNTPVPEVCQGGARVKVHYAGVCYTEKQVQKSGKKRPRMRSISDTSLYPGYEVSGVIDAICNTVENLRFKVGDKVIVYPEDGSEDEGYSEFIVVKDINNLIKIPDTLSMEVAAMLPTGALTALSAVKRTTPFVECKIKQREGKDEKPVNILIVGAGALSLWTITLGRYLNQDEKKKGKVHLVVADTNMEKLMIAKDLGCYDVIHWSDAVHEEHLIDRTKSVCEGGVDVVIDFASSPRTINRAMKVLAKEGVLVVGGNSQYEVPFCLRTLAQNQQTVIGVSKGKREDLSDLIDWIAKGEVTPPVHQIFPVEDANSVLKQLNDFKIHGRALLQVCSLDSDDLA